METLLKNAEAQFKKFGKVTITIYPNRSASDSYAITETTIEDAISTISHFYGSFCDDLHVSHCNSI